MRLGALGPPHANEPTREAIRDRQLEQARRAGWPQLQAADLVEWRFGVLEHRPSGRFYRRLRGEVGDSLYSSVSAYFRNERDEVVFLEPPAGGPATVAELEQWQAERDQRRNAPKPRPRVTRR